MVHQIESLNSTRRSSIHISGEKTSWYIPSITANHKHLIPLKSLSLFPLSLFSAITPHLIDLLALESRQPLSYILPLLGTLDEVLDGLADVVQASAHLLGGVAVTQGEGVVLDGLKVDGDAEGGAELVITL